MAQKFGLSFTSLGVARKAVEEIANPVIHAVVLQQLQPQHEQITKEWPDNVLNKQQTHF